MAHQGDRQIIDDTEMSVNHALLVSICLCDLELGL